MICSKPTTAEPKWISNSVHKPVGASRRRDRLSAETEACNAVTRLLWLAALIPEVSSLPISTSVQRLLSAPLWIFIWSSEPQLNARTSKRRRRGREWRLSLLVCRRPPRDSWDRSRGPSALTLHTETLSAGPPLRSYQPVRPLQPRPLVSGGHVTLAAFLSDPLADGTVVRGRLQTSH